VRLVGGLEIDQVKETIMTQLMAKKAKQTVEELKKAANVEIIDL
jgi:hypothetical protein